MLRSVGQVLLPLLALALIGLGPWGGDARAGREDTIAPAVATDLAGDAVLMQGDEEASAAEKGKKGKKSKKKGGDEEQSSEIVEAVVVDTSHRAIFEPNAFPPVIPDTEWHQDAWLRDDCLRCHETGVGDAPQIVHEGMPEILMAAKCRSCHVFIEGAAAPEPREEPATHFNDNAFPPMIPASGSHRTAWTKDDCLLCHDSGISGAPIVKHEGMPDVLLKAKCRSCHVQIRTTEATEDW